MDQRDWHYSDSHGLVVWDNVGHGIGVLHASQALELLEQLLARDDWKSEGIPIREHSVRLSLDSPKHETGRRKKQHRDLAVKWLAEPAGKKEDHWEERLRLKGQAAEEFLDFLRRHEAQLRQVADADDERFNHAVMKFWRMMFGHQFDEQVRAVELAGRSLPWTRVENPTGLTCEVPPDKGRIVVDKEGFWWQSSIEAPDEVPVYGPFAMEVTEAMEWVEQTLPKHRAEQIAQQQARAAEEAAEAARMAALRGKSLKRYWIDASDLEPERITYRAVIELEYAPFHAKQLKLRSGEVIDTDREFYTPTMLAQQIGLDGAHVDVEQPLDFLGWYWVRSATTYHQAVVAASQAQSLWNQSKVLERFRDTKLVRARYGYQEVETRYARWLGECAPPDRLWGPVLTRSEYLAEQALTETMVAALDVDGWRKSLKLGFRDHSDAAILRVLHEKRAESRYQSARARAESSRWLQDHPENAVVRRSDTGAAKPASPRSRRSHTRDGAH